MHVNLDSDDIDLIRQALAWYQIELNDTKQNEQYSKILAKLDAPSLQSLGGAATKGITSEAKKKSSAENGKKGGRPKKQI